jgi:DNA-binding transcriptional MerR regulator
MGFTIKELETLSGIKAHTIRIWEQRYRFLKPIRTSTNIRRYTNEELKTLLTVALLNKYGYKISKIDKMLPDQRNIELLSIPESEAQAENIVNELIGCMVALENERFEQILQDHIYQQGIFNTTKSIIFHFLNKTGVLWQTGRINPAHEHIVSNIIRQKLVAAIDKLPQPSKNKSLFLLLLPEGEYHELGLLLVSYLLKQKELPVIYLGANVPLKDANYVVNIKSPYYLYLHLTSSPPRLNFQKFISNLCNSNPQCKILLSGFINDNVVRSLPSNVVFLQSLPQVLAYISKL